MYVGVSVLVVYKTGRQEWMEQQLILMNKGRDVMAYLLSLSVWHSRVIQAL